MLIYVLKMSSRKAQKTRLFAFRPEASTPNEKAKVQVYIHMRMDGTIYALLSQNRSNSQVSKRYIAV